MVRVYVNKEVCIMCGVCWSLAPEIFEPSPGIGKTRLKDPYRLEDDEKHSLGEVPDTQRDRVELAAQSCPTGSIRIVE